MALYSAGTVTVQTGSSTVTGAGTAWFGALQSGWMFIGPDGRTIGIADVVDNTTIALTNPYLGPSGSGQDYECFPTQSLAGDLATAFRDLITRFQGVIDGAGAGKFANGSPGAPGVRFAADEDTGMRRIGSNELALVAGGQDKFRVKGNEASGGVVQSAPTDATAGRLLKMGAFGLGDTVGAAEMGADFAVDLPTGLYQGAGVDGLNYPDGTEYGVHLNIKRGGQNYRLSLGSTPGRGLGFISQLDDDGTVVEGPHEFLARNVISGTVSEASGTPTGAIIERGSNSNGHYVRYADGTQICWRNDFPIQYSWAKTLLTSWTFPAIFADNSYAISLQMVNAAQLTSTQRAAPILFDLNQGNVFPGYAQIRAWSEAGLFSSGDFLTTHITAIGRWY